MKITYIKPTGHTYGLTIEINSYLESTPDYASDASDWDAKGYEEIDFDIIDCYSLHKGKSLEYLKVFNDDDLEDIYQLVLNKYKEEQEGYL